MRFNSVKRKHETSHTILYKHFTLEFLGFISNEDRSNVNNVDVGIFYKSDSDSGGLRNGIK